MDRWPPSLRAALSPPKHVNGLLQTSYSLALTLSFSLLSSSRSLVVMFRQTAARARQTISPLLKRASTRARSGADRTFRSDTIQRPFWNSGRALLFSAVTGTTTYFYGVNDEPHRIQMPWLKSTGPQYATKHEMEKVGLSATSSVRIAHHGCLRLSWS